MDALLSVRNLTIRYRTGGDQETPAADGVSFEVHAGESVGLLGESGCGKTSIALSMMRLLPGTGRIVAGEVYLRGQNLLTLSPREMERVRGGEISLIFQEPSIALNPVMRVGDQIAEVLRAHKPWPMRRCRDEAQVLLRQVSLEDAARIYQAFPHELSGGQKQRILIAAAVASGPSLIIADEPTTGLDTRIQSEILDLLKDLQVRSNTAFLCISHHPGVLARLVDRLLVMYAGRIVEEGNLIEICKRPLHPYTKGLLRSLPDMRAGGDGLRRRLSPIPGSPPDMAALPVGCPFAPRCAERMDVCDRRDPPDVYLGEHRRARCFVYEDRREESCGT